MQSITNFQKFKTVDLIHSAIFATLIMIGANITAFAPFLMVGGVPITFQTFFAILSGLVLGGKKGAIACTVYLCIGLAGAPVFSKFTGGFSSLLSPNFGFIMSFILSAYVAGKIVEKYKTKKSYVVAALIATAINYFLGTTWLYVAFKLWVSAPTGFTYQLAWLWMIPPMPKDIILAIFAGVFAYRIQRTLKLLP
ncbi:BioY family transporter [Lysinibacillus sp. 2017]|uniref:biotin transporter BioY n=1 Tax=unclassified Lysinibacillus TaxID=2636778 RepID=UPI000D529655|nr:MULTISPECIES: biotin transporter BioY [unclassified Lysinibacillus]AWE08205.1 BioY family transporter [Lysinibacillus sp. 2017]TGN36291.1 biotin transporter BioY [Lysinibacillus sp. S2017]